MKYERSSHSQTRSSWPSRDQISFDPSQIIEKGRPVSSCLIDFSVQVRHESGVWPSCAVTGGDVWGGGELALFNASVNSKLGKINLRCTVISCPQLPHIKGIIANKVCFTRRAFALTTALSWTRLCDDSGLCTRDLQRTDPNLAASNPRTAGLIGGIPRVASIKLHLDRSHLPDYLPILEGLICLARHRTQIGAPTPPAVPHMAHSHDLD